MTTRELDTSDDQEVQRPQRSLDTVPVEEMRQKITLHEAWLASGRKGEGRADFSKKDLTDQVDVWMGRDLSYANFEEADISGCTFSSVKLEHCNFDGIEAYDTKFLVGGSPPGSLQWATFEPTKTRHANPRLSQFNIDCYKVTFTGANLIRAQFTGNTGLEGAVFYNAHLQDAILINTLGLTTQSFAGANLAGAILPEELKRFQGVDHGDKVIAQAKRIFTMTILACLFCWITIGMTRDAGLLLNSYSSSLPILGAGIPLVGFYVVAPLLLLCVFLYLHMYLQRLWDVWGGLPAVFQDGLPLDRTAYPWLFSGLLRTNVELLRKDSPPLSWLQFGLSILLGWWLVPFTVLAFWLHFLRTRMLKWSVLHLCLLISSILIAFALQWLMKRTLRGPSVQVSSGRKAWPSALTWGLVVSLFVSAAAGLVTWLAFHDTPSLLGYRLYPSIAMQDISEKLLPWSGDSLQVRMVRGARLTERDLSRLEAFGAFLIKANLFKSVLNEADFSSADLRGADLYGVIAQHTWFNQADLSSADLTMADLHSADFTAAQLQGSKLLGAILDGVSLRGAVLKGADLTRATIIGAVLQDADLRGVSGISVNSLRSARGWQLAFYDSVLADQLDLPVDHNARLRNHNLATYNMVSADLRGLFVTEFSLPWANLDSVKADSIKLDRSSLHFAKMRHASFRHLQGYGMVMVEADASYSNFDSADIQGAFLVNANLTGASFRGVEFSATDFTGAILDSCDMRGANLSGARGLVVAQLRHAIIDSNTILHQAQVDSLGNGVSVSEYIRRREQRAKGGGN